MKYRFSDVFKFTFQITLAQEEDYEGELKKSQSKIFGKIEALLIEGFFVGMELNSRKGMVA